MKKIYKPLSQALTVLGILLFTATGCGSDDKKDLPNETLEGLWRLTEMKHVPIIVVDEDTVSVEVTEEEVTDETSTIYPDNNGLQPYYRFKASTYEYFEVTGTQSTTREQGPYTVADKEISTQPSGLPTNIYAYEITGNKLIMIQIDSASEIYYYAEKVAVDPFLPEEPADDETDQTDDEEETTGCAVYHDTVNAIPGSSLNPILIETGLEVKDSLYAVEGTNGYEARYYLQVEPYDAYRIKIKAINSDYNEVISFFKYTRISVNDAFSTDQHIFQTEIEMGDKIPLQFDLFPTTTCLYIEFFSYEQEVDFLFEVENLSGTQE